MSGSPTNALTPRFGYSGDVHDGSLQYLRARYYDTELGVFINEDTYRGRLSNQLSQNRYLYTENNPVNSIDPSGHFLSKLVMALKRLLPRFETTNAVVKKIATIPVVQKVINSKPVQKVVNSAAGRTVKVAAKYVNDALNKGVSSANKIFVSNSIKELSAYNK